MKQFDRANTLDFYVHALQSTYRVAQADGRGIHVLYESLASAHYVEEAKKGNRTRRLQEAKTPRTLLYIV